jgi:hypothetical protein
MLNFGDRQIHIEDLPWYIFLPCSYLLIVVIAFLFEQEPMIKMQPAGHNFAPGQPKCQIFQSVSLRQTGSVLNFTFGISARFEISIQQAWRSFRVRISGDNGHEVLRSQDASGSGMVNHTHGFVAFVPSIAGPSTVEAFCSDTPLSSFAVELPSAPPPGFGPTFFGLGWVGPVCLANGRIELFTTRAVAPPSVRGWTPTFTRELFGNRAVEGSRAVQFRVPGIEKFPGDLAAPAFIASARDQRALMMLYGDRQLAADIAAVHPLFHERGSVTACVKRFEYAKELKRIEEFEAVDFAEARAILPAPKGEDRRTFLVELKDSPLEIEGDLPFEKVKLWVLSARILPFVFNDTNLLIVPFQAPVGLIAFLRTFTKVAVVRPEGFPCQSALERSLRVSGLAFTFVNATFVAGEQCNEMCGCVDSAKYQIKADKITALLDS